MKLISTKLNTDARPILTTPLEKDMVPISSVGMEDDENVQLLANGAKSRRPSPPKSSERFQDFSVQSIY